MVLCARQPEHFSGSVHWVIKNSFLELVDDKAAAQPRPRAISEFTGIKAIESGPLSNVDNSLAKADACELVPSDTRTTVMLRNIPNRYDRNALLALLDEQGFATLYDFVYLPMDFRNGVSLGYAFVNFVTYPQALEAVNRFQNFRAWSFDSSKVCEVSWAHPHQGLDSHIERYRNSPVMHPSMPDEYKPAIFDGGKRISFPRPTKAIRAPRLRLPVRVLRGSGHHNA
jgi:hypothetical protein